jgi:hypothetical protein
MTQQRASLLDGTISPNLAPVSQRLPAQSLKDIKFRWNFLCDIPLNVE